MVSVLQKELEYKVEKLTYKKVQLDYMQPRIRIKSGLPVGKINKPSRISPHEVLQSWLINTVYHLLVKNK